MSGKCKFSDKVCHYKHDEDKKGIKTNKRKRSEEGGLNTETGQVDFLQGLVRTLAQGTAGEAKLGSRRGSTHGMENERNNRPRMESPEISSRGMEGQRGCNSYASRTRSPRSWDNTRAGLSTTARTRSPGGMSAGPAAGITADRAVLPEGWTSRH